MRMATGREKRKKIRLKPELVPRSLWGKSVYQKLRAEGRRRDWERIRKDVLKRAKGKCQICGHFQEKGMICHEKWRYGKKDLVATLTGFKIVCPMCNNSLHFGRTIAVIWEKDPEILRQVIQHVARVNDISEQEAQDVLDKGFFDWMEIADGNWRINIDPRLTSRFPELEGLEL